ncbi:MAG: cytochrome c [Phototrophicaceae bacterium]
MSKQIIERVLLLGIISLIISACSDLAGNVEIVATSAPSVAQVSDIDLDQPVNPPNIANGERIYQQNCTSCHGLTGAGDGTLVESGDVPRMGSFRDPAHMRQQTVAFYYDIITNGNLINLMPPWSGSLSEQERWDVAMYAYTLHYTPEQIERGAELVESPSSAIQFESDTQLADATGLSGEDAYAAVAYERLQSVRNWGVSAAEVTEEPIVILENVNFSGQVSQGSPNAAFPSGLQIQLQYGDFLETTEIINGVIDANGQYSFPDIPVLANSTYFVVVFYDGRAFISDPLVTRDLQADNALDVVVYETSSAPNIVNQTGIELVFDYLTVDNLGSGLVTNHLSIYDNPTDYVFHLSPDGQDVRISLLISLPVGAIFLDAPEQSNFIQVQDQFALIDTRPVYPGLHTAETSYFLPYVDSAQTVDIRVNNRFNGEVSIIMIDPELRVTGNGFTLSETINLASEEAPVMANVYTATLDLQAGESVIFDIEGRISQNTSDTAGLLTQDQLIPILIGIIVIVILLGGGITWYLRRNSNSPHRQIEQIVSEIVRLEALHDAGQLNHDVFQDKRKALKEKLAQLMSESNQA